MPPQRMQLDQTNSSTAFTQPEQRPRRSTIHSITRSHGPYREQRQRINSDLEADQDDEKPLPLDTSTSSSNSQPHRLHDSDGAALDQWNQHRSSGQSTGDSQDTTPVSSPVYRTTGSTGKRSLQRPPPPRLPGHGRSQSDLNLESISPGFNRSVSSPLASPITATANSLTALTISSSGPYGVSGRDLSKITVPRERRATTTARPYSVCSTESLLTQDRMKNGFGVSHSTIHLNQLSDSEISSVHDHGTRGRGSKAKRSHVQPPPSPSLPTASHSSSSTKTPVGLKSPTMKPASQLRVTLYNLVSNGYLPAETLVVFREHSAIITAKGTLIPQMKEPDAMAIYPWLQDEYETPSAWATAMVKGGRTGKVAVNGWSAIKVPIHQDTELSKKYEGLGVAEASLDVFRKKYLAEMTDDGALAAADDTSSGRGGKDADSLDRKKRKRPLARSGEAAGLRVATTGTRSYKGKAEPTRPRKRTVSDLSGMVSSDLLQDRQLRWEAAGVLFSMQDGLMSPTYDGFERRRTPHHRWSRHRGIIPLESLERRRQEQESKRRHSSASRLPALRTLRPLSLVPVAIPLQLTSSMAHMEFCVLCGGSGSTARYHRRHSNQSHQWSSVESTEPEVGDIKADRDVMRRCFDCGECYHMNCLPSDSTGDRDTSVLDESWRCPRCTTCQLCEKSVYEQPPASVSVGSPSSDATPSVETDSIKALVCDHCHEFTHLQCQVVVEPALKPALRSPANRHTQEWMCLTCRECVECGHRVERASGQTGEGDDETSAVDKHTQGPATVEGRWSHGSALCPSCTVLAEKGNVCPLCCTIYQDDDYETPMIFCDGCSHWVHVACDKGLEDRDYEELGEDSKQYICPSCIPTPIPSPALSSSSSILSTAHSNDESSWTGTCGHGLFGTASCFDCSKEIQAYNEDDWHIRSSKKKDDILDLLKAAKEISDSESRNTSPYTSYTSMFPTTHSRTMSTSLESVAEVAAAEALLTIFSGASTPISSTPYTSYPPSPFEPSFNGPYDRHYSVINSPNDHALVVGSMAFTPSSDQESTGSSRDRYGFPQEDYFNSRSYSRPAIPYHHIGQELELASAQPKLFSQQEQIIEPGDVVMEEGRAGLQSPRVSEERGLSALPMSSSKNGTHPDLYRPLAPPHHSFQRRSSSEVVPTTESLADIVDTRTCLLCHHGPSLSSDSAASDHSVLGRLLPLTLQSYGHSRQDTDSSTSAGWIHSNCALWSTGVTLEAIGGGMENVSRVVSQSLDVCCSSCGRPGATIKCKTSASKATDNPNACTATFHYACVNHLDQLQHQGHASNNAVVMDHKQRTILCSMHHREISTLNNLRSTAFALESSGPSSDSSAPSTLSNPLVPPVTLRTAWTGPFWIKNSLLTLQHAYASESVVQETSMVGFRIGGLTIHILGKFDSPESVYSETGLANDVDLEACYEMISDKPLADLGSRDRVLALPLGFKCSRRIVLNEHRLCVTTAEVVQRRRQPQGSVETAVSTGIGDLTHPGSDELDTAWKIMLVFSGYDPPQDCEFFADSMQDAVDKIISFSSGDLDNEHQSPRQYGLYLHSADAFFGIDHPLVRNSIRAKKGEKEVASRMWTRYRQVRRAVDRQCSKGGCSNQSRRHQGRDSQEDDNGDWESTTAARVRLRTGSLLLRKRVSRIGIARGRDPSSSDAAELKDVDIKETTLVPGLLQELIKTSTSTSSNARPDGIAPTGSNKVTLSKSHQQQEQQDSLLDPENEKALPALEMNIEQLQTLRTDQMKNVALFWNGRKMVSSQIRAILTPVAQPSQSPGRQPLAAADGVDDGKEPSTQTLEGMEVDGTTQIHLYPGSSQAKLSSSTAASSRLLPEAHADVRVYTTCSFKSDEVIMEYTGEVVHPSIAVRRQESYQSQGRSCYMMWCEFQDAVIDATMRGGLARYIRNEHRHLRKQDNDPQQKRTVYARTVAGPGLQGPKVVICAAEPLEAGTELILRYC
ncbi:hypothetical protein EC957_004847 [Mortierella hygrophila]|uniref:PHD-type domain-containing protein n=1 Tax=Mortierella hygrophila TaxID=979708 RepID=A0A9P6F060_9FUNG|nr:hypothetical protein EC957_004847 [Mortierella hygrophila]